jgi:PKD repeat protein
MKNKFYKLIVFSLIFGAADFTATAQLNCGTDQATKKLYEKHPELAAAEAAYNADLNALMNRSEGDRSDTTTVYIIPVVFHIIHQNGSENIPDANVFDAVNILNRDYRKQNPDTSTVRRPFRGAIADARIEFRLAQIDPNGNCTNGIDRIYSHKTNNADDDSKLNQWPRDKYLNVWVVKTIGSAGVAGYAYYPSATTGFLYPYDGILILYNYIGSLSPSAPGLSRALTHEIGHYLNLSHPWGNTNDPGVACGDDGVNDTPPTKGHTACTSADLNNAVCTVYPITANYKFDSVTTGSGASDPTPLTVITGTTYTPFTANGVSANSSIAKKFAYSGWDTGAPDGATTFSSLTGTINTSKYYEFTVKPSSISYQMTLTGITFEVNRSATGPRTYAVRSSKDGFAANLPASITPANTNLAVQTGNIFFMKFDSTSVQKGTKITLGSSFAIDTTTVKFRIYAYNAEDAAGSFGIDSVYLSGTDGLFENTENYMDYSYCSKMYTWGQKDRMRTALQSGTSSRNNLWSAANLAATGVSSPAACVPHPEFFSNKNRICKGDVVRFTKNVLYGTPDSIRWTFYGGSPATSTSTAAINVTYPNSGLYKVVLTAYNSAGVDSVVKTDYVRVDEWTDVDYNGNYTENWSSVNDLAWMWSVKNYDNNINTWYLHNTAGIGGSKCVYMKAYDNYAFDVDDLYSPSFDLFSTNSNVFTFKCAAASSAGTAADVTDALKFYASTNCGVTWNLLATFKDSTLINNGYQPTEWTPTSSSVWTTRTVNLTSAYNVGNVRFKFEYTSGPAGNNIYLDDLNIAGVVGVNENPVFNANLSIYPNPSNQTSTIAYHLAKKGNVKIEVVDVLGKVVFSQTNNGQQEGDYSVLISKQNLNMINGIYFVKFSVDNESTTKKLIITE